jgi:hypothetical protein
MDLDMLRLRAEMVRGLVAGLLLAVTAIALVIALDGPPPVTCGSRTDARADGCRPPASP